MNLRIVTLLAAATALAPGVAGATVNQPPPGNESMPQPVGASELTVVTARGFPASADTLAGLFAAFNGGGDAALDPVAAAQTTPGSFTPQCGLTASIVLHGGGCKNAIGWYNATEPATVPAQIFSIIPANLQLAPPSGIGCYDGDFCPLATRTTTQTFHTWADPLPAFAAGVRGNPNWSGGKVGFALIGNSPASSQCTQTKYSQAELNDKSPSGAPWITALVYKSVADPNGYYLAFEDLPTCASSWKGCPTSLYTNDGDFNDFVVYITDVACTDGGAGGTSGGGGTTGSGGTTGAGGTIGRGGTTGTAGSSGAAGTSGTAGTSGAAGTAGTSGSSGDGGSAGTDGGGATGAGGATGTGGAGSHPDGTEGGACYGNGTCNAGLICLSHLCVQPPDAGLTPRRVGGCGCETAGLTGTAPWTLLMLGCALLVVGRRRAKRIGAPSNRDL